MRAREAGEIGSETWPADQVERWPLTKLIPYARNARTHSDEQVAQIAASIREWGWTVPVLVDEQGTLIAGHGRVLAAQQLGITDVPTMVARGWTPAQIQAYRLTDNQLALNAGWDRELLGIELGELKLGGFDLALTGFGELELGDLLADRTQGLTDPDDAPEAPEHPVSRTGDLWLLGRHRLLCGDSTVATDVEHDTTEIKTWSCGRPAAGPRCGASRPLRRVTMRRSPGRCPRSSASVRCRPCSNTSTNSTGRDEQSSRCPVPAPRSAGGPRGRPDPVSRISGHPRRRQAAKSGARSVTTHEAALADYMKYKTGQAGDAADPPTGRPAPDAAHQAALEHASRLLVPSYRLEQQQRAAEAEADRRTGTGVLPLMQLSAVDLPHPEGPSSPMNSPRRIVRSRRSRAAAAPKRRVTPPVLNAGWDRALLGIELGELKLGGFDLALTGFGELELGDLLADRTQGHARKG
jgi:ParB-like nuclease domain